MPGDGGGGIGPGEGDGLLGQEEGVCNAVTPEVDEEADLADVVALEARARGSQGSQGRKAEAVRDRENEGAAAD